MYPRVFTLVSSEDPSRVFAFGLEVVDSGGDVQVAMTYRQDPRSGQSCFSTHLSAEAACVRFSMVTPLTLVPGDADIGVPASRREGRTRTPACVGRPRDTR